MSHYMSKFQAQRLRCKMDTALMEIYRRIVTIIDAGVILRAHFLSVIQINVVEGSIE